MLRRDRTLWPDYLSEFQATRSELDYFSIESGFELRQKLLRLCGTECARVPHLILDKRGNALLLAAGQNLTVNLPMLRSAGFPGVGSSIGAGSLLQLVSQKRIRQNGNDGLCQRETTCPPQATISQVGDTGIAVGHNGSTSGK